MSDPQLRNLFTIKFCYNCEQHRVGSFGHNRVATCALTGKKLTTENEGTRNRFPDWCPKRAESVIIGEFPCRKSK